MRGRLVDVPCFDGEVDNHNHSYNSKVGVQHGSLAAFPFPLVLRKS